MPSQYFLTESMPLVRFSEMYHFICSKRWTMACAVFYSIKSGFESWFVCIFLVNFLNKLMHKLCFAAIFILSGAFWQYLLHDVCITSKIDCALINYLWYLSQKHLMCIFSSKKLLRLCSVYVSWNTMQNLIL